MDEKLQHYRRIAERVGDKLTTAAVENLAEQYTAQKLAMHPKPEEPFLGRRVEHLD
ncbi:hypothetical protein GGD65_004508 [Bradyrhizobium sp. CIR18]|uniref:hypothetical protein n=1 Tax=Bradyrhizobium sp. CIR18 TaxID=2663839 RepID=UPI0016057B1D|nr:hypothetical protein [Bradyrhizobium sp. CIR18]MBB4363471.1 hypothetical protein [Bradyrhizobium sp. CIR18]